MQVLHRCSIALSLAIMITPTFAATSFEPAAYVGAGVGRATVSSKYLDDSSGISSGLRLGYQATRNLGVEGYFRSLSFNPLRDLVSEVGYYPDRHHGVAVVGTAPLNEHFSIHGRLGVGSTRLKR